MPKVAERHLLLFDVQFKEENPLVLTPICHADLNIKMDRGWKSAMLVFPDKPATNKRFGKIRA